MARLGYRSVIVVGLLFFSYLFLLNHYFSPRDDEPKVDRKVGEDQPNVGFRLQPSSQQSQQSQQQSQQVQTTGNSAFDIIKRDLKFVCNRTDADVAVVIPFQEAKVDKVVAHMERWKKSDYLPCLPGHEVPVDLIFFTDRKGPNFDSAVKRPIEDQLASMPNQRKCFRNIKFITAGLGDKPESKFTEVNIMFFHLWKMPADEQPDYFMNMETDCWPIRPNWLKKIWIEAVCGDEFWVKGSINRNTNAGEVKLYGFHINGNAIYNTCKRDAFCREWTKLVEADLYGNPYDFAMWWYYHDPRNVPTARNALHMYSYSDFVVNWYHNQEWDASKVAAMYPNTYLVHGQKHSAASV
eukprot:TRINITY_DN2001_c0_g1_i4.p1 TRINITY_DN2001_c0_g1~~TRINITY_DN2001_c0_g1_i4.p1  ORF type:complete len:352 (+),score=71.59 TRINITY_DN2001_c0_g1_i4:32-1087(+)